MLDFQLVALTAMIEAPINSIWYIWFVFTNEQGQSIEKRWLTFWVLSLTPASEREGFKIKKNERGVRVWGQFYMLLKTKTAQKIQYYLITGSVPKLSDFIGLWPNSDLLGQKGPKMVWFYTQKSNFDKNEQK